MSDFEGLYRDDKGRLRLGDKIEYLAKQKGLDTKTFATQCDLTYLTASDIFHNTHIPLLYELENISRCLGVTIPNLLTNTQWDGGRRKQDW